MEQGMKLKNQHHLAKFVQLIVRMLLFVGGGVRYTKCHKIFCRLT